MTFCSFRFSGGTHLRVARPFARQKWLTALTLFACISVAPAGGSLALAEDTLQRTVALSELGFEKGVEFTSFGGQHDFYFPVPPSGLKSAVLRLKLNAGAAVAGRRHVLISAGGRPVQTLPLEGREAEQTVVMPVDTQLAKDGFLQVSLRYSGAYTQDRCVDQRVAGDFLNVLPSSALEMEFEPQAFADVGPVASLMPREVRIVLPNRALKANEAASAIRIASVLKRKGTTVTVETAASALKEGTGKTWSRGTVLIGQTSDFYENIPDGGAINGIAVASTLAGPALLISGKDPGPAIALLGSRWKALADRPTLTVTEVERESGPRASISLADLGASLQSANMVDQTRFDVTFSAERLPPGHRVSGVRADLAVGVAPNMANATIALFLNGRLLGSRASPGAVPATLTASVPEGLIGRDNILSVQVQRQPLTGNCMNPPQGYPVQFLPSSVLELTPSSGPPAGFYALGSTFASGADVYLPADPAEARDALALFAASAADLLPETAAVTVRFGAPEMAPDVPFIAVLRQIPPGTSAHLRFDKGRLTINSDDGKVLVDMTTSEVPAVAQIVQSELATGLWLRPGDAALASKVPPVRLDHGTVALIGNTGISLAFTPGRERVVNIVYHDIRSWTDLALEYRPWLVAAFWFALTLLFIGVLSGMYRRKRKG